MKKLLVVLLAVAMLFTFSVTALAVDAFPDLADQSQAVKDAFGLMKALGVVEGYEDGTVRAAADITRAEFSKMACVVAGMGSSGDVLKGTASIFSDVKAGDWYTGWINLAVAQGFMKGYTDGTFKPNQNITMQEVITVCLRIGGYTDNLPGPWPIDYISKAGALGLTENVSFIATQNASRGATAVFFDNLLEQDIVFWDPDKEKFVIETVQVGGTAVNVSVLEDKFKGDVFKDVVFDYAKDAEYMVKAWQYKNFAKNEKRLVGLSNASAPTTLAENYGISGTFELFDLSGLTATLITETKTNGDQFVKYIDVKSTKAIVSDDVSLEGKRIKVSGQYYNLATGYVIDPAVTANPDGSNKAVSGIHRVIVNKDGDVSLVYDIDALNSNPKIASAYNETSKRLEYLEGSSLSLTNKQVVVIKDNVFAELKDIEKYDGVTVLSAGSPANVDYVLIVSSPVEGKMDAAFTGVPGQVRIDGKKIKLGATNAKYSDNAGEDFTAISYDVLTGYAVTELEDYMDEDVIYVTNRINRIGYLIFGGKGNAKLYGVITSINTTNSSTGRINEIEVYTEKGENVTYKIDNSDGTIISEVGAGIPAGITVDAGAFIHFRVNADNQIDDVEVISNANIFGASTSVALKPDNSADITDVATVYTLNDDGVGADGRYDQDNHRLDLTPAASYMTVVGKNAPIFNIKYEETFAAGNYYYTIDKVELVTVSSFFSKDDLSFNEMGSFVKDGVVVALAAVGLGGMSDYYYDIVQESTISKKTIVTFYNLTGDGNASAEWDSATAPVKKSVVYRYKLSGEKASAIQTLYAYDRATQVGTFTAATITSMKAGATLLTTLQNKAVVDVATNGNSITVLNDNGTPVTTDDVEVTYLLDKDTVIYDFTDLYKYGIGSAGNPRKVDLSDVEPGYIVSVVTSDDDAKTGYDNIALFIMVEKDN